MNLSDKDNWRDFVTNPIYGQFVDELQTMLGKEVGTLCSICLTAASEQIKVQAGVVDGMKRLINFMIGKADNAFKTLGEDAEKQQAGHRP